MSNSPVIVALDYDNSRDALSLADRLDPQSCRVKVGKELFTAVGPQMVRDLQDRGFEVFLDLKFHDIPNTTARAVCTAADLGVWMVNVHAVGGSTMLQTASQRLRDGGYKTILIGVTLLTSISADEYSQLGFRPSLPEQVEALTALALASGLDGVVCSAREAKVLRNRFGSAPILVTPGIRGRQDAADDQQRTLTPEAALAAGSTYLVIGRPITKAPSPTEALQDVIGRLASAVNAP